MKKFSLIIVVLVSVFSACQKNDDPAPGQSPDERVNQALAEYKALLVGAEHGWKAVLYPEGGAGYSFLFRFAENDRVTMSADINASTAAEPLESSYRLKAMQRPSLLFDTYSYLHILSDPDERRSGGDRGEGRYSDFEFSFETATAESITLVGNLKGSRLVLTRATAEEASTFIPQIAEKAQAFENISNLTTYFKRLRIGSSTFDVAVQPGVRVITFSYYEGNVLQTFTTTYYFTENGLTLLEPLVTSAFTITSLENITYSTSNKRLNLTVNNTAATIQEVNRPIQVDREARNRFHSAPDTYWLSITGFTVEGKEDAFNLASLPNFSLLVYWPKYGTENAQSYDLMGFVFGNAINYGPAATANLTTDGRIIFTYFGDLGEIPEEHLPVVTATREQWTDPEGYYVVQTGADTYDLVSAKDAKTWISFF